MAEEEPVDPQIEGEGEGGAAEEFPGETEAEAPLEAEEGAEPRKSLVRSNCGAIC